MNVQVGDWRVERAEERWWVECRWKMNARGWFDCRCGAESMLWEPMWRCCPYCGKPLVTEGDKP